MNIKSEKLPQTVVKRGGFTIVELLIATLVFSMVLVLIAFGVMKFNRAYYGGITQSNTQNTARAVLESISQAVQFSGQAVTETGSSAARDGTTYYFCAGGTRYRYILGWELTDGSPVPAAHQTYHALVTDQPGGCDASGTTTTINSSSLSGTELLSPNMRLSNIVVQQVSGSMGLYKIEVRVAYGDDDLLCAPSVSGSCANLAGTSGATAPDTECKVTAGSQFCAVSDLSTVVQKRVD